MIPPERIQTKEYNFPHHMVAVITWANKFHIKKVSFPNIKKAAWLFYQWNVCFNLLSFILELPAAAYNCLIYWANWKYMTLLIE